MTGVEVLLLVIGVVFFIASFFITEKLTPGELNKIGELSNDEIQKVMQRELEKVSGEIEGRVEEKMEEALMNSEISMEKEANERITSIGEYADTVVESMNKTHNEIMFLYSMLNDKHVELTQFSSELQELASDLEKKNEEIASHLMNEVVFEEPKSEPTVSKEEMTLPPVEWEDENSDEEFFGNKDEFNHNEAILALHKEGKSSIAIAKELSLGLGEVQLVIGLYEGKRKK